MNSQILILVPFLGAVLAALWPNNRSRPLLLPAFALLHALLACWFLIRPPAYDPAAWLAFDPLARAVLPGVSLLFLGCAGFAVGYLRAHSQGNRVFVAALLLVLGLLSAGHQARHLGILWIATEGVTLACVPLIHFLGTPRAFEATWKYLLVGGTGIALSLLGSICLGYASLHGGGSGDITFATLLAQGPHLSKVWVLAAWVLLLVGYGTKMGLAPMHTWKPDTYGESPGIVGAILAGGVTSVAFMAILRIKPVIDAAGESAVASGTLLGLGLFSTLVAALFLLRTKDFKRMLAYSSIEHMGILSIAASLGEAGLWAALFHIWSNGLTKGALFLGASNLEQAGGSSSMEHVRGMFHLMPKSSAIFVTGMFAITACPPFAPFFSELLVLRAGFAAGQGWAMGLFLFCLLLAFFGLSRIVFAVVDGRPRARQNAPRRIAENVGLILPPLALLTASLWLGLFTPEVLKDAWSAAVLQLVAQP
ncbi:MAG: Fe-S-binding domain-containing protein [Deltaproteobacteria bacterium]|nr:Fe-S-binding domain-containing protein [Deltaproteobacteria bacterium]